MKKRILVTLYILDGLSAIPLIIGILYLYTEAEKVQRSIFVNEVLSAGNEAVDRIDAIIKNDTNALFEMDAESMDQQKIDTAGIVAMQQSRKFLIDSVNNQPIGVIKSTVYFQENDSRIIANDTEYFTAAYRRLFPQYNDPGDPKNVKNDITNIFNIKDINLIQLDSATRELLSEEKLAVVLGSEGPGLKASTIAASDYTVRIPMAHGVDSLNVAAASAVAFWELRAV